MFDGQMSTAIDVLALHEDNILSMHKVSIEK